MSGAPDTLVDFHTDHRVQLLLRVVVGLGLLFAPEWLTSNIMGGKVGPGVEINQCVGCSFLDDDVAALAPSSGEEPASPRHRAGVASMAWRSTR